MFVAILTAWRLSRPPEAEAPPLQVVQITTLPGHESSPTFSPDGSQVAFAWDGEKADNADIYVKIIGASEVRQLTTNPLEDIGPSWSPDGRQIAFVRSRAGTPGGGRIHLASPMGGTDLKLTDFPALAPLTWSPDGRYLAAQRAVAPETASENSNGIYLIPVQGGEPRHIVRSKPPASDFAPAFSPDGRRLAYASCAASIAGCHVYVIELDAALAPTAPARRLTTRSVLIIGSLAWTRDGRAVVYSAQPGPFMAYLWQVAADGTRPPERIEVAGRGATMPATVLASDRLAFVRELSDTDVYRFETGRPPQPVVSSTFPDTESRFSPDGRRLAFSSMRSGERAEVWIAAADGSRAQQLTDGPGYIQGSPSWSPDGRRIVFDSFGDDWHAHLWIVDADGGTPHQLTTAAGDQHVPSWSRDGNWIYFSTPGMHYFLRPGTRFDIWRVAATGGPPERLTQGGSGRFACESPDGKSLLYQPKDSDSALLAMPLTGGPARQLVACVRATAFGIGPEGVYYVACDPGPIRRFM